jgi:hypothetical protein
LKLNNVWTLGAKGETSACSGRSLICPIDALNEASLRGEPSHSPAETLKRARAEYVRGNYANVVRMLESAAQEFTAAAQQTASDAPVRIRAGRSAATVSRSDFLRALRLEMPAAVDKIRKAGVGPVDMPQSVIGPGMGVFSRYARVRSRLCFARACLRT